MSLEVRLPRERTIEGRVVAPDGKGVADARVRADPIGPPGPDYPQHDAPVHWWLAEDLRTDAEGRFRIGRLGEGRHRVFALPPSAFAPPVPLVASAGAADVVLLARPGTTAEVRVLDPDGVPVAGAHVVVAPRRDTDVELTVANLLGRYGSGTEFVADAGGTARVAGLDAEARYVLGVRAPSVRKDLAPHVERDWSPGSLTVRLARGLVVAGVVRDAEGRPVAGAFLRAEGEDGVSLFQETRDDGSFRFSGLPAGRVLLRGVGAGISSRRVAAGAEDVVLVVEAAR
jgi:protocatechuate 3,4-dioxygenase beta subunit